MSNKFDDEEYSVSERFLRGGRLENEDVFVQSFTKYSLESRKFKKNERLKYITEVGGIPVGRSDDGENVLVDSSDVHTLIIGSTGSKKSRLVVMPSIYILGDAGESMIVSDPKAEIYDRTAEYLHNKGYRIQVINLRQPSVGNAWNPLSIPYTFYKNEDIDKACEFVNDITVNLMLSEQSKEPYWDHSAGDLFFGLTLLLFKYCKAMEYEDEYVCIGNLLKLRQYLFQNRNYNNYFYKKFIQEDEIISSSLMGTIEAPNDTRSCILSTFDEKMRCFVIQPNLLEMLSNNSILMDYISERKTIMYLIMPDEKTSYHKLVTLFIKQSYEYLIYKAQSNEDGKMKVRVNYILDEFSSLPTIKDFPAMITAARSRNIRFNLIIQSKHQLIERYKDETETIQSNCTNWIFFTSREVKLLEELSLLCGKKANGEKSVIPLDALQHFNKNRGEALVLSGRLYPYITRLIDIDKYDGGKNSKMDFVKEARRKRPMINFGDKEVKPKEQIKKETKNKSIEFGSEFQLDLEMEFEKLFGESNDGEDK